jgi:hypothetical protein
MNLEGDPPQFGVGPGNLGTSGKLPRRPAHYFYATLIREQILKLSIFLVCTILHTPDKCTQYATCG